MAKTTVAKKKVVKKKVVKKAAVKKVVKPQPKNKSPYMVLLDINSERLVAEGNSVVECLEQIAPPFFKTKGTFTICFGELKASKVMYPFQIRRLLANKFDKEVFQNRMLRVLK